METKAGLETLEHMHGVLEEKRNGKGSSGKLANFYCDLLAVQIAHLQQSEPLAVGHCLNAVVARVDQGLPACDPQGLPVDTAILRSLSAALASVMDRDGLLDSDHSQAFLNSAARFPFLNRYAAAVLPHLNLPLWQKGSCPICGGQPGFAALLKVSRERHLVCLDCGTVWPFKRLCCPFCGNERQELLGYHAAGSGPYRVFICDSCHRYLKAIDLACAGMERISLFVESLLSHELDDMAAAIGYSPA